MWSAAVVLACALDMLGRRTLTVPAVEFVDAVPPDVSPRAEAFTRHGSDIIYLVTSTDVFRRAQSTIIRCSDYESTRKLASIIVHEAWHIQYGPDEQGAYEAQLITLITLGAGSGSQTYDSVRRAMAAAVKAQRTSRTPVAFEASRSP
jgi:hypothetical protein